MAGAESAAGKEKLHCRAVFFVEDAERSLAHYTEKLGFTLDWNYQEQDRAFVFQVSLMGIELIINQAESWTESRAGHGRVFIGLEDTQVASLRRHIRDKDIEVRRFHWGAPTLVICDLDGNELFFWIPEQELAGFGDLVGYREKAGEQ